MIVIDQVSRRFGAVVAVDEVSLQIAQGEFFSLLGPSGCGKTTLMRMIAGFEIPDQGTISIDGQDMAGVPANRRPVNMMFQSYALFPHMTVAANIGFGLSQQGKPRADINAEVTRLLALVRLQGLEERKPHQLSGGQKQRVALARALARKPKVLLLDEPLGALDKSLRQETQSELKRIQRETGATFVIVTHDQEEAMTLSDRIAVLRRGKIAQVGSPLVLYERPADTAVAAFLGDINFLPVSAGVQGRLHLTEYGVSGVTLPPDSAAEDTMIGIRPEVIRLAEKQSVSDADLVFDAVVRQRIQLGHTQVVTLETVHGQKLDARLRPDLELPLDTPQRWLVNRNQVVVLRKADA